jgi:glycosyltransferase involved in cell wall biosynthesis
VSDVGESTQRLRVLLFSQRFVPEVSASRVRMEAFATGLAERGHEVVVICEVPNHPEGVVRPDFRGTLVARRRVDGVGVRYVWVKASRRKSFRTRIAMYGSYAAIAAIVGLLESRPDVILATSPPLFVGVAAAAAAARHRVPWVFDVRDLWPEAALAVGELGPGAKLKAAEGLERLLYRSASHVIVTSPAYRPQIERWKPAEAVSVVPNGTSPEALAAGEIEVSRAQLGLPADRFVWMYAGNLGVLQGLDALLEAARRLGDGFQLELVGDGPVRDRLQQRASGDPRIRFRGSVPPAEASALMRAADALVVSLDAHPALAKCVPSKLYDSAAVGRPVVLAGSGESRRLMEETGAAICVPPNDPQALVEAIRRLREEPDLGRSLAERGRAFARARTRADGVAELERILRSVTADQRRTASSSAS